MNYLVIHTGWSIHTAQTGTVYRLSAGPSFMTNETHVLYWSHGPAHRFSKYLETMPVPRQCTDWNIAQRNAMMHAHCTEERLCCRWALCIMQGCPRTKPGVRSWSVPYLLVYGR